MAKITWDKFWDEIGRSVKSYKGKIPAIAEKEKRGKKVKIPKQEPYVQELTSNVELNIPTTN